MHPEECTTASSVSDRIALGQPHHPDARAIPGHIDAVAIKAKQLHEVCEELHERLSPVLGPPNPEGEELKAVLPDVSPVAGQLIAVHGVLHSLERRLREIIGRVEL